MWNGIYLSRGNLDVAFEDSGRQINPLTARLTGNVAGVMKLLIAVAGRHSLSLVPPPSVRIVVTPIENTNDRMGTDRETNFTRT
jgi:hypothetical protein